MLKQHLPYVKQFDWQNNKLPWLFLALRECNRPVLVDDEEELWIVTWQLLAAAATGKFWWAVWLVWQPTTHPHMNNQSWQAHATSMPTTIHRHTQHVQLATHRHTQTACQPFIHSHLQSANTHTCTCTVTLTYTLLARQPIIHHTHTRLTALFRDYPGEPVPER